MDKQEKFLTRAKELFGDKYDFSKFVYINAHTKGIVICPIHGDFEITPNNLLNHKNGCKKCATDKTRKTTEQFIIDAKKIHGNKYDYSKVDYSGNKKNVTIICPIHGEFWQKAENHLHGANCPYCAKSSIKSTKRS